MERKERDRMKIRQWMKSQHNERNKKYLEQLDQKRASEFRPFVSNAQVNFVLISLGFLPLILKKQQRN